MRLMDLLAVCSDELIIGVWDEEGRNLGTYDGKNSISEEFNEWCVVSITEGDGCYYGRRCATALDVLVVKEGQ